MHQEFRTSGWIAQHCGNAGSEKWASTCSVAILDYIDWELLCKETLVLHLISTRVVQEYRKYI